jgi:putative endonuclease
MFQINDGQGCTEIVQSDDGRSVQAPPDMTVPPRQCHANAYSKGIDAETLAAKTLQRKGFRILDRRYRTRAGELDLVVADRDRLAFVEVKRRSSRLEAVEAITARQQMRMTGAAEIWLQQHPEYANRDMTFDAILICPRSAPHHIHDAFRPGV